MGLNVVEGHLKVAAACVNITPAVGCALAGHGAREKHATTVDDELFARVLVLDDGTNRSAALSLDLIGVPRALAERLGAEVERRAGVPVSNCLACGTHTHFGPVVEEAHYLRDGLRGSPDEAWPEWTPFDRGSEGAILPAGIEAAHAAIGGASHEEAQEVRG